MCKQGAHGITSQPKSIQRPHPSNRYFSGGWVWEGGRRSPCNQHAAAVTTAPLQVAVSAVLVEQAGTAGLPPSGPAQPYDRVFNFSAGPAVLPVEVLEQAQADLLNWRGSGESCGLCFAPSSRQLSRQVPAVRGACSSVACSIATAAHPAWQA